MDRGNRKKKYLIVFLIIVSLTMLNTPCKGNVIDKGLEALKILIRGNAIKPKVFKEFIEGTIRISKKEIDKLLISSGCFVLAKSMDNFVLMNLNDLNTEDELIPRGIYTFDTVNNRGGSDAMERCLAISFRYRNVSVTHKTKIRDFFFLKPKGNTESVIKRLAGSTPHAHESQSSNWDAIITTPWSPYYRNPLIQALIEKQPNILIEFHQTNISIKNFLSFLEETIQADPSMTINDFFKKLIAGYGKILKQKYPNKIYMVEIIELEALSKKLKEIESNKIELAKPDKGQ
ncbi:MAG: hypothetical protein KAW12_28870 [Candidatus Aminicenantes bacterium]|nr:hypothetical protein [Candidatus Aminicenantes bacterium]